jgi:hypothetical protein
MNYCVFLSGLAMKCVQLSRGGSSTAENAWDWLAENNPTSPRNDIGSSSSVEAAWKLLESLVTRLQSKEGGSQIHKGKMSSSVDRL